MAGEQFKYLFTPFEIGPITVKNRLVFLPHGNGYCINGFPEERLYYYFVERAKGGVGLIIEGGHMVHPSTRYRNGIDAYDERIIPFFRRVSDAVHQYGTKIISQLHHCGSGVVQDRRAMWAPSDVPDPWARNEIPKPMEKEDIEEVILGYVKTALHTKEGGYDGVELKAGHDGLLREFWSSASNLRQDDYGGSLDNRMRLILEILKAVRGAVGRDYVLGVRACLDELMPGGYDLEEGIEIGRRLADSGLTDYINVDIATFKMLHLTNPPMDMPLGCNVWASAALKEAVDLPVIAFARINDPVQSERILAEGHADLIGMARQLLCDPETPNKAREGQIDDIRHCMACNQGCLGNQAAGGNLQCVHNPAASNEKELGIGTIKMAEVKKKVIIVGGGPAGMKVAELAARRGHQVTIYEKNDELGGQVRLAEKGPKREDFGEVIHWLEIQLRKLGCRIMTGVEATVQSVNAEKPDAVVIATGARLAKPDSIIGAEQDNVVTPWEVLKGTCKVGRKILLFCTWGTSAATSAAELVANQDKQVEIVTPNPFFGSDLAPGRMFPLYQRLLEKGVLLTPFTAIAQIQGKVITLRNVFSQQTQVRTEIDTVILSTPARANDELYFTLKGKVTELHRVGDCIAPRDVDAAIYEGEMVGRAL